MSRNKQNWTVIPICQKFIWNGQRTNMFKHRSWKPTSACSHTKTLTRLPIRFFYDELFLAKFGADAAARIDAVFVFAQGFFNLPTLGTIIELVKLPYVPLATKLTDGASSATLWVIKIQVEF